MLNFGVLNKAFNLKVEDEALGVKDDNLKINFKKLL